MTALALVIFIIAGILFASPMFAMAQQQQQAGLTQEEQEQANRMSSIQRMTTQYLDEGQKQIGGLVFTPRWSPAGDNLVFVEPGSLDLLFAYCLPGEFAVSGLQMFAASDIVVLESYPIAFPDFMAWLTVVENQNNNERVAASTGVVCASGKDGQQQITPNAAISPEKRDPGEQQQQSPTNTTEASSEEQDVAVSEEEQQQHGQGQQGEETSQEVQERSPEATEESNESSEGSEATGGENEGT